MKKTKIVCTMGPGTDGDGILEQLLNAGMNVGRCNFSHGDHEEQLCRITKLRAASQKVGKPVALLLDTKGPEMRLGKFKGGKTFLTKNSTFIITADEVEGTNERASVNHKLLPQEVQTGNMILLSDGLISLRVEAIKGNDIITTAVSYTHLDVYKRQPMLLTIIPSGRISFNCVKSCSNSPHSRSIVALGVVTIIFALCFPPISIAAFISLRLHGLWGRKASPPI